MAVFIEGTNLWDLEDKADVIVVSTNSFINKDGKLVMGRGIALEAANRYPELPELFGQKIPHLGVYGLVIVKLKGKLFGAFQVKKHFRDKADPELIRRASKSLKDFATENSGFTVYMNFPGIGYGRLAHRKEDIREILSVLPDNVYVFSL